MSLQIPMVTLEDLQAFQAKHFPGQTHTPSFEYPDNVENEVEHEDDEEDLGYYPDGVKRTLTDEQIRIFRHSEIHSILRQRQLAEEERAYEEGRNTSEGMDEMETEVSEKEAKKEEQPAEDVGSLDYGESSQDQSSKNRRQSASHFGRKIISYDD